MAESTTPKTDDATDDATDATAEATASPEPDESAAPPSDEDSASARDDDAEADDDASSADAEDTSADDADATSSDDASDDDAAEDASEGSDDSAPPALDLAPVQPEDASGADDGDDSASDADEPDDAEDSAEDDAEAAHEDEPLDPAPIAPLSPPSAHSAPPRPRPVAHEPIVVEGRTEDKPAPRWVKIFFGVTGISLALYLGRLVGRWVLGHKRHGKLSVQGAAVRLEERTRFAGREIKASHESFARADVLSVRLEHRYPYLLTLVGLLCLGVGVIAGVMLLLDGVQGEFTPWIVSGVALLMVGVILDLVFTTVAASLPGQAALIIHLPDKRTRRLVGCDPHQAEAIIRWLEQHDDAAS